jgi:hypothetical protein
MRVTKLRIKSESDWCHRCGERRKIEFVEFTIPRNAEHSTNDAERGFFRICRICIEDFNRAIKNPEKYQNYGPVSGGVAEVIDGS